jgi:hypothetical protein
MFSILDEQSSLPKCTDITLVDSFHKQFATHANYEKPRFGNESFIIKHFAGAVMCDALLTSLLLIAAVLDVQGGFTASSGTSLPGSLTRTETKSATT